MNVLNDPVRRQLAMRPRHARQRWNQGFFWFCIATASLSVVVLALLLGTIAWQGLRFLSLHLLLGFAESEAADSGVAPAIMGTVWVCGLCALMALPLGVGAAIFLEEFKPRHRLMQKLHGFIQLNITNLAGVPSVVYGILGMSAFVTMFGLFGTPKTPAWEFGIRYFDQFTTVGYEVVDDDGSRRRVDKVAFVPVPDYRAPYTEPVPGMTAFVDGRRTELNVIPRSAPLPADQELLLRTLRASDECGRMSVESWYAFRLPFGSAVIAGGLTLMLVVLPVIIIASQEALRAVPDSLREASLGMGCTRWQMVRQVTLPAASPGILTGAILAMSRAIGEAAPILIISGVVYINFLPKNMLSGFTVMPLQIYSWAGDAKSEFRELAASAIIVLLLVLLTFNAVAIVLRQRWQKPLS